MCSKICVENKQLSFQQGFLFTYLSSIRAAFQQILLSAYYADTEATMMSKADLVSALLELISSMEQMDNETSTNATGRGLCPGPGGSGETFWKYH